MSVLCESVRVLVYGSVLWVCMSVCCMSTYCVVECA